MKSGLWGYIKAAFNARPLGMFVAPNWVGVAAFGLLGLLNPGFWAIGAGLELAYLFVLSTNRRFQNVVDATDAHEAQEGSAEKVHKLVNQLIPPARKRYEGLEQRCRAILDQQRLGHAHATALDLQAQAEGLGRLLWIYLRLLVSRQSFEGLLQDSVRADESGRHGEPLEKRIQRLERQLRDPPPEPDDLRKSLESQVQILQQRVESQREAREKLAFLNAELTRIEEQVELLREQSVLTTDPATVSNRIDQIAATLGGTNQWIRDQQQLYGQVEDVLEEPPPVLVVESGGRVAQ